MSTMKALFKTSTLALLLATTAPGHAGNVTFLDNSAISKMTEADIEIMRAAARNVLDYTADGESRRWENKESNATGVLTPLATFQLDGSHCRRLELFNEVKGISGRSVFVFCQQPDGTWKVPPNADAAPK